MTYRNAILVGDVREKLRELPDECVQTVVTSPPYWGLRDYNVPGQLGLEATPEEFVANLVDVFREVRRVLCKDGTVWLNLGDSYAAGTQTGGTNGYHDGRANRKERRSGGVPKSLKPKDLVGIPWRVAFALQADGWWLRSDIIWSKPNPMPESVTDRPTKAHEYLFLLSKSERYYYDAEAIREPALYGYQTGRSAWVSGGENGDGHRSGGSGSAVRNPETGRNRRTVWEIATEPYTEAHFATYPTALVKPCILAGSREGDLVLDPFLGSGTTALVAKLAGRDYVGIELNATYAELAKARINVDQERLL